MTDLAPFNPTRVRGYSDERLALHAEQAAAAAEIARRRDELPYTPPAPNPKDELLRIERAIADLTRERQRVLRRLRGQENGAAGELQTQAERLLTVIRKLRRQRKALAAAQAGD